MKSIAAFTAFVALALAAPTPEDRPLFEAREDEFVHLAARGCFVSSQPNMGVARQAYNIGKSRGINDKEMLALFEALRVESNFQNIACGDKDSVGVLQQRPSVDHWGGYNDCMNVNHAVNAFITDLQKCYNNAPWKSAGQLAQCTQISERPDAYDRVEGVARSILNQVKGSSGGGGGDGGAVNVGHAPGKGNNNNSGGGGGGGSGSCSKTAKAVSGDTCSKIASKHGLNTKAFMDMNKSINGGCTNLQVGKSYCVAKGGKPTGGKKASSPPPSGGGCKGHHTAKKGDTCSKLAGIGGIGVKTFLDLNPSVNDGCTNLAIGKSYCVKA